MKKSNLLRIVSVLFIISSLNLNAFAQEQSSSGQQNNTQYAVSADPVDIPIAQNPPQETNERNDSQPSPVLELLKIVFFLAVVIALIYGVVWLMRRSAKISNDNDPFLRKVSQISLSPGKSVQIVTLLDRAYLIGVTDNSISLIGEVDDKELVDSMNLYADKNENVKKPRSFSDILEIFTAKSGKSSAGGIFSSSNPADSIKRQRERFNTGENNESSE